MEGDITCGREVKILSEINNHPFYSTKCSLYITGVLDISVQWLDSALKMGAGEGDAKREKLAGYSIVWFSSVHESVLSDRRLLY